MKKVILLASEDMCDILRSGLDDKYTALPCSSPAACTELLHQDPDALIIDLALNGHDSLAFLKESRSSLPAKIIALTVYFDDELLQFLSELGIPALLRLPFRPEYLIQQL